MNCPYCQKEMEAGLIEGSQALHWYRGLKRRRTGIFIPEEDKLLLSEMDMLRGSAVLAYRCPDCKKLLIDYSRPECDRNSL